MGLAAAVSRAQARYGLNVDGVAGASTLAALNVPVEARLAQIRANLERWRWAPRSLPADRVELNIAGAWFDDYEGGLRVLGMRAVVGGPQDQTPSFTDHIHAVVFYPPGTCRSASPGTSFGQRSADNPDTWPGKDSVSFPGNACSRSRVRRIHSV